MNDAHVETELLHRYFDGDLAASEAEQVTAHVEGCATCAAELRSLRELRRMVGIAAEQSGRDVDFGALFERIEHEVRAQPKAAAVEHMPFSGRARRPQIFIPIAAAALAAAAAVLLVLRPSVTPPATSAGSGAPQALVSTPRPAATPSSEIEQVDFGEKTGTVFEVALADGVSTEVVWIDDDDEQATE